MQPLRRFTRAAQVNLAEDVVTPLTVARNGSVTVQVGGHEIVTVRFSDVPRADSRRSVRTPRQVLGTGGTDCCASSMPSITITTNSSICVVSPPATPP